MDKTKGGARRYTREEKIKAIMKVRAGASMCSVAKEMGSRAHSVKYWVEHADNILGPEDKKALLSLDGLNLNEKTREAVCREGWSAILFQFRQSKKTTDPALLQQRTNFLTQVIPHLMRLDRVSDQPSGERKPSMSREQGDKVIEELEVRIARFTQNRKEKEASDNQRAAPPDGTPSPFDEGQVIDATAEKPEAKGANEAASD